MTPRQLDALWTAHATRERAHAGLPPLETHAPTGTVGDIIALSRMRLG